MSAFNILTTDVLCTNCNSIFSGHLQFKFGETWQHVYQLGDKIKWGGNDIGRPSIPKVKVYGILEEEVCPVCGRKIDSIDFDIIIESDIIKNITPMEDVRDYYPNDGNYMTV